MPPSTDSTDAPPPAGIAGHEQAARARRRARGSVSAAQATIAKNIVRDQHLHDLLEAREAADGDQRAAEHECATAPHGRGTAPPVSVAMPSPHALVSAALTDTVQMHEIDRE